MKLLALALHTSAREATFGMKETGANSVGVSAKHSCLQWTFDRSYRYAFIRIVRDFRIRDHSTVPFKFSPFEIVVSIEKYTSYSP